MRAKPRLTCPFTRDQILAWLDETDPRRLDDLWARADAVRADYVGDGVHLRGLIEVSNHCVRGCGYCGLRAGHAELKRYRLTSETILDCARRAVAMGYGTVVLQAGEDLAITGPWMAAIVRQIKAATPLAVTLSLGERSLDDLLAWKQAGADRYLLRFETSDRQLFSLIHPPARTNPVDRVALLRQLRSIGYEAGSGVMVGIPGQTMESLADDLLLFADLDLDMIGIGPWLPHPATPLGRGEWHRPMALDQTQASGDELMVYKMMALTRLVRPDANIPSTTALATLNRKDGRELGLARGANVIMPNLTPVEYRPLYEIYPAKACIYETAEMCHDCLAGRINRLGRHIASGPGRRGDRTRIGGGAMSSSATAPIAITSRSNHG